MSVFDFKGSLPKPEPKKGPYTKDILPADKGKDPHPDMSPEGEEPRLNEWIHLQSGPDGTEQIEMKFVNGVFVRDQVFIDYVEGGHHYRYDWIPENEIWIEDILARVDQVCTGCHEVHERYLMKHQGWNYNRAHEDACKRERELRDLAIEKGTHLPDSDALTKIFEAEARGESCLPIAEKAFREDDGASKAGT